MDTPAIDEDDVQGAEAQATEIPQAHLQHQSMLFTITFKKTKGRDEALCSYRKTANANRIYDGK